MRIRSLILILAMGLISINTHASISLNDLLEEEEEVAEESLEELVSYEPPMQHRLYTFFKRNKVQRPEYYASLLARHPMLEAKKKIMAAIIVPESRGNCKAVNRRSGATGLCQIMPAWKKRLNIKGSLKDPVVNINAAIRIYDIHLKDAAGNHNKALYAYSGGIHKYSQRINRLIKEI